MSTEPSLTLAVQGERAERLAQREQRFDRRDGSIGRADDCDWVLGAEGVSRLHALIRYLNGLYFVEDRSTNGMLLNGAPLRKGDPAALRDGDRLQIDTFEIAVRLGGETGGHWQDRQAQTDRAPTAPASTSTPRVPPVSAVPAAGAPRCRHRRHRRRPRTASRSISARCFRRASSMRRAMRAVPTA
ncbi:FHA domain-containing protein [Burkholderia gladioli]|uniref:FHA domain-containing protein n=1 Tax=Burkholderia gladioli TaxID=28095 RepID=UPI001642AD4F|nr:FHA domain-containing protein [Burkholderia gladioli]